MTIGQRVEKSRRKVLRLGLTRFWRHKAFIAFDALLAAASLLIAVHLRVGMVLSAEEAQALVTGVPLVAVIAAVTFSRMGLYANMWRYASVPDSGRDHPGHDNRHCCVRLHHVPDVPA